MLKLFESKIKKKIREKIKKIKKKYKILKTK